MTDLQNYVTVFKAHKELCRSYCRSECNTKCHLSLCPIQGTTEAKLALNQIPTLVGDGWEGFLPHNVPPPFVDVFNDISYRLKYVSTYWYIWSFLVVPWHKNSVFSPSPCAMTRLRLRYTHRSGY